jgi:hypothetical protein
LKWKLHVGDLVVLVKSQAVSNAAGVTQKFVRPYVGPWKVTRLINPAIYEVANEHGKITKVFNQSLFTNYG